MERSHSNLYQFSKFTDSCSFSKRNMDAEAPYQAPIWQTSIEYLFNQNKFIYFNTLHFFLAKTIHCHSLFN